MVWAELDASFGDYFTCVKSVACLFSQSFVGCNLLQLCSFWFACFSRLCCSAIVASFVVLLKLCVCEFGLCCEFAATLACRVCVRVSASALLRRANLRSSSARICLRFAPRYQLAFRNVNANANLRVECLLCCACNSKHVWLNARRIQRRDANFVLLFCLLVAQICQFELSLFAWLLNDFSCLHSSFFGARFCGACNKQRREIILNFVAIHSCKPRLRNATQRKPEQDSSNARSFVHSSNKQTQRKEKEEKAEGKNRSTLCKAKAANFFATIFVRATFRFNLHNLMQVEIVCKIVSSRNEAFELCPQIVQIQF